MNFFCFKLCIMLLRQFLIVWLWVFILSSLLTTDFDKPDFKRSIVCLEDLTVGTILTGRVENATLFGVFVDIGVGKAGLIPIRNITEEKLSKAKKRRSLGLGPGEKVEVRVREIDIPRSRITLDLLRVL